MAITYRTVDKIGDVPAEVWDGLANPDASRFNPLVSHVFLQCLEKSGCASAETGWQPSHVVLEDGNTITGLVPAYLKTHSQGEYVFDHGWADAFHRAGGQYYPKLQVSVPFSPVPGPRLLAHGDAQRSLLLAGLVELTQETHCSSAHVTFLPENDWQNAGQSWLQRKDIQFHWQNSGYENFDAFLGSLSSSKRKNIRKERRSVAERGISFEHVSGGDLTEDHWDHFFAFYLDTGGRKWGRPYLNRLFFSLINETMAEHTLLVLAKREGRIIAAALNFIGGDRLFGRNWGCLEDHPFLHFETCYYQAIDYAIANNLKVVEAGAQGEHKLARGYVPVNTYSLHHFAHPGLERAVAAYLAQERQAIDHDTQLLMQHAPFRQTEQD